MKSRRPSSLPKSSDEKPATATPAVERGKALQEAASPALLPDEFASVARDALNEASQAMAEGDHDLVTKNIASPSPPRGSRITTSFSGQWFCAFSTPGKVFSPFRIA